VLNTVALFVCKVFEFSYKNIEIDVYSAVGEGMGGVFKKVR